MAPCVIDLHTDKQSRSVSHPLQIAEVHLAAGCGVIGVTFCPGKWQPNAASGAWSRDLGMDCDAIRDWGAAAVVTLARREELAALKVVGIGEAVMARHMGWHHLPIADVSVPDAAFEQAWRSAGAELRGMLRSGFNVLVHCKGGLGRAGMIAARLAAAPESAIAAVRSALPGAIETRAQEAHVMDTAGIAAVMPDTSAAAIRHRTMGALLDLAVGDAFGSALEFTRRDQLQYSLR